MKELSLLVLLSISIFSCCQDKPIVWETTTRKIDSNTYSVLVKGKIAEGWHVYAEDNKTIGLEKLHFSFDNANVAQSTATSSDTIRILLDPLFDRQKLAVYSGEISFSQAIKMKGPIPASISINIKGFAANHESFIPIEESKKVLLEGGSSENDSKKLSRVDVTKPIANCGDKRDTDKGILEIFFLGFIGGLIALLTPCVFPMVPVTVSYFSNKSASEKQSLVNGLIYGAFIFLIYVIVSVPFHLIGNVNPQLFNTISTNALVNVFFFVVFVVFALSFFGLFEIRMPASITNAAGSKSNLESISGIFFMALTLATVSFSCTGPILGSLLVSSLSSESGAWQLTSGMGGFGLALSLPFGLFAMFPHWMRGLPKSGGWLEVVKKSLAFVELALAIKFLSNADLVMHWGILKREIFIGLWLFIFLALSIYLFNVKWYFRYGKVNVSGGRILFGTMALLFAIYLIPGLTQTKYANLKLLSGFAPPLSYSIYGKGNIKGKGLEPDVINDYDKALRLAKEQNKPLLIDFTGWACVNCRKMEENVWTKPGISELIKDQYILVSLYVDDRKKLPAEQRFTYKFNEGNEKDLETLGDMWATFQAVNFKQVTQPLYVILSPEEKLLNNPVGYTSDAEEYRTWLECGLNAYREK